MFRLKASTILLVTVVGFLLTADKAHGQSVSAAYLDGKGPNGLVDTYAGVLTVGKTFKPSTRSFVGKILPKLSFELDGFAGTGLEYKLNIATVCGLAKYAISPKFWGGAGLWASGDINAFSLSQLELKNVSVFVGIGGSF